MISIPKLPWFLLLAGAAISLYAAVGASADGVLDKATGDDVVSDTAVSSPIAAGALEESSAPNRQTRGLIDGFELLGDLDGDGKEEIVLAFWDAPGGSGVFNYLVILDLANGKISSRSIFVGDRVQILGGEMDGNKIVVNLVEHAVTDPACCPAQKAMRSWAYEKDGNFREMPVKLTGRLSVEDIGGTEWVLAMLNGEAVPENLQISLTYDDGQIKGNAGCNSYFADMKDLEDAGGRIKLGPVGSTRKACPEDVMYMESSYLRSLGNADSFSLAGRKLVLSWNSSDQNGYLSFIPGRKLK